MTTTNGYLAREKLLQPMERQYIEHELPDWGRVRFQTLNAKERGEFEADLAAAYAKGPGELRDALIAAKVRLIAIALVNQHGERMLSEDDAPALLNQDGRVIDQLYALAKDHAGVDKNDIEELKAAGKNL